jgi:hypothetical protein
MRTVEDQTYSLSQLVNCEQSVRLDYLALTMDPLGLHRVEPRTLFGQEGAGLDVVAVGVEHVGAVVAFVVLGSQPRRAVIAPSFLQRRGVETVHGLPAGSGR